MISRLSYQRNQYGVEKIYNIDSLKLVHPLVISRYRKGGQIHEKLMDGSIVSYRHDGGKTKRETNGRIEITDAGGNVTKVYNPKLKLTYDLSKLRPVVIDNETSIKYNIAPTSVIKRDASGNLVEMTKSGKKLILGAFGAKS